MRLHYKFFALIFLGLLPSCRDFGPEPAGPYDYTFIDRNGAGDLGFNLFPTSSADSIQVVVIHQQFRDTTSEMVLLRTDSTAKSFNALLSALRGDITITGDFRQSTLPTGTWVRVYMIKGQAKFEVTNADLRNTLLVFEQIVRSNLGKFQPLAP